MSGESGRAETDTDGTLPCAASQPPVPRTTTYHPPAPANPFSSLYASNNSTSYLNGTVAAYPTVTGEQSVAAQQVSGIW